MNLQEQVVSLELSKKLKKLGFKQESLFWWVKGRVDFGYEGEWDICDDVDWFLFDVRVGYKISEIDLELDTGSMGETDEDFDELSKKQKIAKELFLKNNIVPAYTVAELGEILKTAFREMPGVMINDPRGYFKRAWQKITGFEDEANYRAKMLIYLKENNLLK